MSTTAADVRAVCQTCSEVFHPRSHGQRYCSRPCVDASRRKPRTCQRDGCDAPPRGHGAKHCQYHTDEIARQRAAEITQRRSKAWLPRPKAPTEVQLAAFLRNRRVIRGRLAAASLG